MIRSPFASSAAFLLLAASGALAQTPAPPYEPAGPVISSTTRLVQVSVVAKAHDRPAEGLKAENFKVFVDGHPQKISFFSEESTGKLGAALAAPALPPHSFTNIAPARAQSMNGITIVLLDLVNTRLTDRIFARKQLIKFLLSIPADQRVAVYLFNGRLSVLHDYTADMSQFQQQLAVAKDRLVNVSNTEAGGALEAGDDSAISDLIANPMGGGGGQERSFFLRNRVLGTLNILKFIASHFAAVPGRKNLVWLSGGFPITFGYEHMSNFSEDFFNEMDATVRSLSDANVAVYPVDARGLVAEPGYDASKAAPATPISPSRGRGRNGGASNPAASGAPKAPGNHLADIHQTMDDLAHRTGGHAYYNTNDLARAILEATEDSTLTYTLGFYPESEKHNRQFHKLKVEVTQPHINLNYRSGYLDLAEIPSDDRTRSIQIHDALWSPLEATELSLGVNLTKPLSSGSVFTGGSQPVSPNALSVAVSVQPRGIQLKPDGDRHTGRIDILMVQFDASGKPVDSPMETVALNMLDPTYRKFLDEGISVRETLNVLPQTKTIRVIVRDFGSGMIGSVSVPMKDIQAAL